jgi:hypothetical protein
MFTWLWIAFLSPVRRLLIRVEVDAEVSREVAVVSDAIEVSEIPTDRPRE